MTVEEIYVAIAPKLTNYLVGSGSSYATACDIVQETFVRVWKRRDELLDDWDQVGGFVFTIARNYRVDLLRKTARETLQPEILDAGSYQSDFESDDEAAEIRRRVDAALATLPPTLREAFALFRLGGLSVREIARQTNTTESNVKVRIHRATAKMRIALGTSGRRSG